MWEGHDRRLLMGLGRVEERELACPACGHVWYADGREEYGVFVVDEDDLYCPCCGVEGEA